MKGTCLLCAGEGTNLDGTLCECQKEVDVFTGFNDKICTFIPEQYADCVFHKTLLPPLKSVVYGDRMMDLYNEIINMELVNKNHFISSPMKTGKTVFAYSAIRRLFNMNIPVFPYLDMLELRRIIQDVDNGKGYLYKDSNFETANIYDAPYLFVKVPLEINTQVCDTIAQLIDRRTRRGKSTIIFSHCNWEKLVEVDYNHTFKSLQGDGSFGTLKYNNYW